MTGPGALAVLVAWGRTADLGPTHEALLDPAELARAASFRRPADRCRFVAGAALARLAVGRFVDRPAASITLGRECPDCVRPAAAPHGRPFVVDRPGLDLSITHSGGVAGVAVTAGARLGLDVELIEPPGPPLGHLLDARERAELAALPTGVQAAAAYRCWVAKEAVLKATGTGLRTAMTDVPLTGLAGEPELARGPGRLVVLAAPAGYVARLAVLSEHPIAVAVAPDLLGGTLPG